MELYNKMVIYGVNFRVTHPDVGVNLFFKASNLSKVLPDCLLEMQDAAALLLRVTRNLQLETHTLLFLTVLLDTPHGG